MSHVTTIVVEDYEERYAPPESPVLEISYVGPGADIEKDPGLVFLTISKYDETHDSSTYTKIAHFALPANDLINSLIALGAAQPVQHLIGVIES